MNRARSVVVGLALCGLCLGTAAAQDKGAAPAAGAPAAPKQPKQPKPKQPKGPMPGKGDPLAAPAPAANIDVAAARKELFGADAERAEAAAKRLGTTRQAGALDALLDALALGLPPRVAAAALEAAGNHKSAGAVDVLLHYARHRSPEVRAAAVSALGNIDDRRARAGVWAALRDGDRNVRAAACKVAQATRDKAAEQPLIQLLVKGDEAAAPALAAMATPDLARRLGELIGNAPDDLLARTLGLVLLRPDFGKEEAYVEVVVALGKIPGEEALVALTNFISAVPENPPRLSRRKAQEIYELRLSGGSN